MRARRRVLLTALICATSWLHGQSRVRAFFPVDDRLQTLAEEIEDLVALNNENPARDRLNELIAALFAEARHAPVTLAPTHAASPWGFLGALWPRLSDTLRAQLRQKLLDRLASRPPFLVLRVCDAIPDPELRAAFALPLALRCLEEGRFAEAERCALFAGRAAPPAAALQLAAITEHFLRPDTLTAATSSDPEIDRIRERIRAEETAARHGVQKYAPWASVGAAVLPGSLTRRYPFAHHVAAYTGAINAAFPAIVGTQVYAFNGSAILALTRDSATPRWESVCPGNFCELRNTILAPAVDGRRVYVARAGTLAAFTRESGALEWAVFASIDAKRALDWRAEPPAAPVLIHTTPPLRAAGMVYVGMTVPSLQQTSAYVAAFTPDEGVLCWCVKVGAVEGTDILGLGTSPLPLAWHAGRLYFCPNLGFLAAVDADDGSIAFLRTYTRLDLLGGEYAIRRDSRWQLAPPLLSGSTLLVAPQDSNDLIGFDLRDGAMLFRVAREDGQYFLGAVKDRLFIVGRSLRAVSLKPDAMGSTLFRIPLSAPSVGRGQLINNLLAVPCRDRLVFFSTDNGAALSTHLWDAPAGGGNIASAPWGLVVTHPQGVDVYRDVNEDAAEIDTMSAENDIRHLKRARLALKTRDFTTAFEELSSFHSRAAPFSTPEELSERSHVCQLIEAWVAMDIPADIKTRLCRTRADIAATEGEAVSALLKEGELHEAAGATAEALRTYYTALGTAGTLTLPVAWDLEVDAAAYLTARISALIDRTQERDVLMSEFNAAAAVRLRNAEKARHVQAFLAVSRGWPRTRAGQQAYISAAELYLANQNSAGAIGILTDYLRGYPRGELAPDALALLAQIFEAGGQNAKAHATYAALENAASDAVITTREGTRMNASAWARERAAACPASTNSEEEASLRLPLMLQWFTRRDLLDRPSAVRLLAPAPNADVLFVLGEEFLRVYDKERGVLRFVVETPERTLNVACVGEAPARTLVIASAREILGVPYDTGEPERFRIPLAGKDEPERFLQDVQSDSHTFVTLAGTTLRAFDASGTQRWECALPARARAPLCGSARAILALAAFGGDAWVIDRETGAITATIAAGAAEQRLSAPPLAVGSDAALAIYGADLCLIDAASRAVAWRRRIADLTPSEARFLPDRPDTLYVWGHAAAQGSRLVAINRTNGDRRWHRDFPDDMPILDIAATIDDAIVLCGDTTRSLVALTHEAGETKELWRTRLYESFDASLPLIMAGGSVFHGDRDTNRIVAVSLARGNIQTEGLSAVRRFLGGRLLRDYRADREALYVLTEDALARFVFHDLYRPRVTKEALTYEVLSRERDLDAQFELGRSLLTSGEEHPALGFLSGVLWDQWAAPSQAEILWQLLGAVQEEAARTKDVIIRCFPAPPDVEIDGILNEWWPLEPALTLDRPAYITAIQSPHAMVPPWCGPNDLSAKLFCAWDADHFYFALDVRDNVVLLHDTEAETWMGDCLVIDVDPEGDGGLFGSRDDRMFTLFLTFQPPQARKDDAKALKGRYKLRVSEDRTGLVYECAFRWDDLGFDGVTRKVAPGATFGFNVVIADDDTGTGARQALSLNASHVLSWKRDRAWETYTPDFFPKIVLEDAAGGPGGPKSR